MLIPIECNKKLILYLSNLLFGRLHRAIMKIVEERNIFITNNLSLLIEETDQNQYGPRGVHADIAEYLKTKCEALLFAELVRQAIDDTQESFKKAEGALDALNIFHQELLNYAQELD